MENSDTSNLVGREERVVEPINGSHHRILLNDESTAPIAIVRRAEPENIHVRSAQDHHGHASENGEVNYFADLSTHIQNASSVLLLGHGTGKANAAERFSHYLRDHQKAIAIKVLALETVNLPALSNGEIVHEAHRKWRELVSRS